LDSILHKGVPVASYRELQVKEKYFKTKGHRHWIFATEDSERLFPNGKPLVISLFCASDVPIKRHIKIRGEANPFDPQFKTYFEDRSISKLRDKLKRRNDQV
jgi:RNA-directed DNA polymerase